MTQLWYQRCVYTKSCFSNYFGDSNGFCIFLALMLLIASYLLPICPRSQFKKNIYLCFCHLITATVAVAEVILQLQLCLCKHEGVFTQVKLLSQLLLQQQWFLHFLSSNLSDCFCQCIPGVNLKRIFNFVFLLYDYSYCCSC